MNREPTRREGFRSGEPAQKLKISSDPDNVCSRGGIPNEARDRPGNNYPIQAPTLFLGTIEHRITDISAEVTLSTGHTKDKQLDSSNHFLSPRSRYRYLQ